MPPSSHVIVFAASLERPKMGMDRRLEIYIACPFRMLLTSAGESSLDGTKKPWESRFSEEALQRRWERSLWSWFAHLTASTSVFVRLGPREIVLVERNSANFGTPPLGSGELDVWDCADSSPGSGEVFSRDS